MTEEEAIEKFQELGYSYKDQEITRTDGPSSKTFHKDSDLPNILVFPSGTDFTAIDLYQEGAIFLQDKVRHIRMCMHTHTHTHTHTKFAYMYVHACVCMYVCKRARVCVCVCVCVCVSESQALTWSP